MPDYGEKFTDDELRKLTKEVEAVYKQASEEVEAKLKDYFRRFEIKDKIWAEKVASGEKTLSDYTEWRKGQLIVGERWKQMSATLAKDYHNANVIARNIAMGHRAAVYAENFNYATYLTELRANVNTAFTLYNRDAVAKVLREHPELLPPPGSQSIPVKWERYKAGEDVKLTAEERKAFNAALAEGKDIRWQEGQIQSVTVQAIAQGESIPEMTSRIAKTMGEINHAATIRYARTALGSAQNAGRMDAFHRAEDLGIPMMKRWEAVIDDRTRHNHRMLDQQMKPIDEPFEVDGEEIMFPRDPTASPGMVYNCRCAVDGIPKGWNPTGWRRSLQDTVHGTYDEWKNSRYETSRPMDYQEKMANYMKWRTIHEDYKRS